MPWLIATQSAPCRYLFADLKVPNFRRNSEGLYPRNPSNDALQRLGGVRVAIVKECHQPVPQPVVGYGLSQDLNRRGQSTIIVLARACEQVNLGEHDDTRPPVLRSHDDTRPRVEVL